MTGRESIVILVKKLGAGNAGEGIDLTAKIKSFQYTDSERKTDKLELTVDNYDLSNFDDPVWEHGSQLAVRWGYAGKMAPARIVVVKKVTGFSELKIECFGKAILAGKVHRSRVWHNARRSDVVREIAEELGFSGDTLWIDKTEELHETLAQAKLTDMQFLLRLAHKEGFVCYVDWDGFHWHRRSLNQKSSRVYTWFSHTAGKKGEVLSITVETDTTRKPTTVKSCGFDPVNKKENCAESSDGTDEQQQAIADVVIRQIQSGKNIGLLAADFNLLPADVKSTLTTQSAFIIDTGDGGDGGTIENPNLVTRAPGEIVANGEVVGSAEVPAALYDSVAKQTVSLQQDAAVEVPWNTPDQEVHTRLSTAETPTEVKTHANKSLRMTQERAVELKMSVVGDPLQLAKTVFTLRGVGKRLSQNYYVREVVHKINAGDYTMDLDSISDGVGGRNTDSRIAKGFELLEPMSAKLGKKGPDFSESTEVELAAGQSLAERDPVVAVQDAQGNLVLVADAKAAAQPTQTQATQVSTANDLSSPPAAEVSGSFSAQQAYRPPIMSKESEAARAFQFPLERPEGAPFSTQPSTPAQATSQGSTVAFVPPPPGLEPSSSDIDDPVGPPISVFNQIELQPVEFVEAVPEEPLSSGP